jgi:glycolate oxidase FAD binding subunit
MSGPTNLPELQEAVRAHPRVLACGAGTKPRPAREPGYTPISTLGLRGLIAYDAAEYTFTAWAGTPLAEVEAALASKGQYLPFDPPWVRAGATLGGTLAAGLSGPGRFRYGGARDFLLAVTAVTGDGEIVRGGARVVKNTAGFELPKLLTGSLGRLAVIAQATFKVFPRPPARRTLVVEAANPAEAVQVLTRVAHARWEADALEYAPAEGRVWIRLAHPAAALDPLTAEIASTWPGRAQVVPDAEAEAFWTSLTEWAPERFGTALARVPVTPDRIPELVAAFAHAPGVRLHLSVGGHLAWIGGDGSFPAALTDTLSAAGLTGVLLRGEGPLRLGAWPPRAIDAALKRALDPEDRFPC